MAELGTYLRSVRAERGWTLREAEKHTGVSNPYISQLETGSIEKPHPDVLRQLAVGYTVPYYTLMEIAGYFVAADYAPLVTELKKGFFRCREHGLGTAVCGECVHDYYGD